MNRIIEVGLYVTIITDHAWKKKQIAIAAQEN